MRNVKELQELTWIRWKNLWTEDWSFEITQEEEKRIKKMKKTYVLGDTSQRNNTCIMEIPGE